MNIMAELVEGLVEVVETREDLRRRLATAFAVETVASSDEPEREYMPVKEYAERLGCSKRHVENLIREGLPLVGRGRWRRVAVRDADAWIARTRTDERLEAVAAADARNTATRATVRRLGTGG